MSKILSPLNIENGFACYILLRWPAEKIFKCNVIEKRNYPGKVCILAKHTQIKCDCIILISKEYSDNYLVNYSERDGLSM